VWGGGSEGGGAQITSRPLFPIFQPLPTLFLASFHEFLKIHQCEVRRERRADGGGWGMAGGGLLSSGLLP
jgi:hypothetical protein